MEIPKGKNSPKLPPRQKGGGAAARQRQFEKERGHHLDAEHEAAIEESEQVAAINDAEQVTDIDDVEQVADVADAELENAHGKKTDATQKPRKKKP